MLDKESRFKRLFGRGVDVSTLELPKMNLAMPESLEDLFEILPQNNKKRKLIQFLKDGYYNPNYEDFTSFENVVEYIFNEYSFRTPQS